MKFPTEKHIEELSADKFGYQKRSKRILDEILLEMELPNCFGLYGNWGSGKSTMLNYIRKHIEGGAREEYKRIIPIYFEPWKYEYSDQKDLLFALLNVIKKQSGGSKKLWKKMMIDAAVISLGVFQKIGLVDSQTVVDNFKLLESKVLEEHELWTDRIEGIKNQFEDIVKEVLSKNGYSKLIIFIDDLDRCLPENAVKLLEGIKNFLSVKNTLFVLAIDRRIIAEMIERKYGLHHGYGDEYLVKIVQYYCELPTVRLEEIVADLLSSFEIKRSVSQERYIVNFLANEAKEPRIGKHILYQFAVMVGLSKEVRDRLITDTEEKFLQHAFVACFLLTRFSRLFSSGDTRELLRSIRDSARIRLTGASADRNGEYGRVVDAYNIGSEMRNKLEAIFMRNPINSGREASPDRLIQDTDQLSAAMESLRMSHLE